MTSDIRSMHTAWMCNSLRCVLSVLILTGTAVAAWALVALDAPWFAACLLTASIVGVFSGLVRVNAPAIVLWGFGAWALSTSLWAPLVDKADWLRGACGLSALLLLAASSVVFLVAAAKDRTRRGRNCGGCNLAVFTLVAWFVVAIGIDRRLRQETEVQQTTETLITLHQLSAEIEAIRSRTGRLPKNEAELVALRGGPLPAYFGSVRFGYRQQAKDRYELSCMLHHFWGAKWDLFGWIVSYRGPESPRRVRAVLF